MTVPKVFLLPGNSLGISYVMHVPIKHNTQCIMYDCMQKGLQQATDMKCVRNSLVEEGLKSIVT